MFCMLQTGLTPLHLSAQEDRVNAAEVLCKNDANLDQQTKVQAQKKKKLLLTSRKNTEMNSKNEHAN